MIMTETKSVQVHELKHEKIRYDDVETIEGYIVYKRNNTWVYSVRCSEMTVRTRDGGTEKTIIQSSRKYVHTGCGYDKTEWAIHTTLNRIVECPLTGGFNCCKMYTNKNSDFYREHYFEIDVQTNTIIIY